MEEEVESLTKRLEKSQLKVGMFRDSNSELYEQLVRKDKAREREKAYQELRHRIKYLEKRLQKYVNRNLMNKTTIALLKEQVKSQPKQ